MSNNIVTRRLFVVSAALASACARARAEPDPTAQLVAVEARLGGRLGVSAACGCAAESIGYRAHERFAMCSTFKAPLAACVLTRVDRGLASLDERLSFGAADLLDHAPVTRARVTEGALSVRDLCAAIVEVSDNTAANLLLRLLGGPAAFTAFLRSLGDAHTRLDRDEPALNTNLPDDPRDTTTPDAMRITMSKLLFGDQILSNASRELFVSWLVNCRTGLERLRAGLPAGWRVGDKTGTGANGAAKRPSRRATAPGHASDRPESTRPALLPRLARGNVSDMVFFEGDDGGDQSGGTGESKPAWGPALIASVITVVIIVAIVVALALT